MAPCQGVYRDSEGQTAFQSRCVCHSSQYRRKTTTTLTNYIPTIYNYGLKEKGAQKEHSSLVLMLLEDQEEDPAVGTAGPGPGANAPGEEVGPEHPMRKLLFVLSTKGA